MGFVGQITFSTQKQVKVAISMKAWHDLMVIADVLPQTVSLETVTKVRVFANLLVFSFFTSLGLTKIRISSSFFVEAHMGCTLF